MFNGLADCVARIVACFVVEDERLVNHDIIPHIAFKIKTQPYVSHN
jgi:hypothetical protein